MVAENGVTLLDGGTGRELQLRGMVKRGSIWSTLALVENPDVVREVHQAFINAGADVIITNNYSTVPKFLLMEGLADRFEELIKLSGRLANEARAQADRPSKVAGALPPLGRSYQPDDVGDEEHNTAVYRQIAQWLAPDVDLFICETMTTAAEARSAVRGAAGLDRPIWVAWCLHEDANGTLRSGETIEQAFAALQGLPVDAFLFNCCTPESISAALPRVRRLTDLPIGCYANSNSGRRQTDGSDVPRDDLDPPGYLDWARDWRAKGAEVIGGCCGIGPAHIALLREALR